MLETGAKMGLTVCRTWAFNDGGYNALQISPGRFDERVFKVHFKIVSQMIALELIQFWDGLSMMDDSCLTWKLYNVCSGLGSCDCRGEEAWC